MSLYYKVIGEGYPVVILHGWTLDHQMMYHALEPIFRNQDDWKRIYIDFPGMGQSEIRDSIKNSDDILDAVLRLLDEVLPNQQFIICGNSYGCYIARGIVHLRKNQVRGLLLVAPMTIPESDKRDVPPQKILKSDNNLISSLSPEDADEFGYMTVVQGQSEWERFRDEILIPSKQTNYEFLDEIRQNGYGFSFNISSEFEYPTLIITGRQDNIVGYRDSWKLIEQYPRATFAVLDMAGHNLQIEQPDIFNSLVHNWLERIEM